MRTLAHLPAPLAAHRSSLGSPSTAAAAAASAGASGAAGAAGAAAASAAPGSLDAAGWLFSAGSDGVVRAWRCGLESRRGSAVPGANARQSKRWALQLDGTLSPLGTEGELHALLLGSARDTDGGALDGGALDGDAPDGGHGHGYGGEGCGHGHGAERGGATEEDHAWLACGGDSGLLYVWGLRGWQRGAPDRTRPPLALRGHSAAVLEITKLPRRGAHHGARADAMIVASASKDRSIRLWQVEPGGAAAAALGCIAPAGSAAAGVASGGGLAHRDVVRALCFVGGDLYSSGRDKTLRLWQRDASVAEAATTASAASAVAWQCARSLTAHTDEVLALAAESHGAWPRRAPLQLGGQAGLLFSASRSGEVRIWDRESLVCLDAWVVHASAIHALLVRDDCLISASGDGTIKVHRAAPARIKGGEQAPPQTA